MALRSCDRRLVSRLAFGCCRDPRANHGVVQTALMPQLRACGQAKGIRKSTDPAAFHQQCGEPIVRPCVLREEQKQAGGTAAPAAPKGDTEIVPEGASPVQPVFVAPPRFGNGIRRCARPGRRCVDDRFTESLFRRFNHAAHARRMVGQYRLRGACRDQLYDRTPHSPRSP